jgi:hypothetical protein
MSYPSYEPLQIGMHIGLSTEYGFSRPFPQNFVSSARNLLNFVEIALG